YARSTSFFKRSLLVNTARTGISTPSTTITPTGSCKNVRYQLRSFKLHERTNTRFSTTTAQMPMTRCGLVPARIPTIFPSRLASHTSLGKRVLGFIALGIEDDGHAGPLLMVAPLFNTLT